MGRAWLAMQWDLRILEILFEDRLLAPNSENPASNCRCLQSSHKL